MAFKILLIDDKESIIASIAGVLTFDGHKVFDANNGKIGLKTLMREELDLVVVDYQMPEMNGMEFIKAAKLIKPDIPIIVLTAFGDISIKDEFIREGAFCYVEKPFDVEVFRATVNDALEHSKLLQDNKKEDTVVQESYYNQEFPGIIGESVLMKKILSMVKRVAKTDATVLIEGESGTGKESIAHAIHELSEQKHGPFIRFNCAAFPEAMIESELFGYEKGSFPGSDTQKLGRFEMAQRGSIFIDEIGELNPSMQVKLLRILQERAFERIGGTETIKATFRVIVATNQNLKKRVEEKTFREDLFYRLNVFPIVLPPLRKRGNDVIRLANYFLKIYSKKYQKSDYHFSEDAIKILQKYIWPGNVRELENVISRAVIICNDGMITDAHLSLEPPESGQFISHALEQQWTEDTLVKYYAQAVYKLCNYNKKKCAEFLNINYRTLMNRLE